jgi:hypothetical protein
MVWFAQCPLYSQKQTSLSAIAMSAKCQKQTSTSVTRAGSGHSPGRPGRRHAAGTHLFSLTTALAVCLGLNAHLARLRFGILERKGHDRARTARPKPHWVCSAGAGSGRRGRSDLFDLTIPAAWRCSPRFGRASGVLETKYGVLAFFSGGE